MLGWQAGLGGWTRTVLKTGVLLGWAGGLGWALYWGAPNPLARPAKPALHKKCQNAYE